MTPLVSRIMQWTPRLLTMAGLAGLLFSAANPQMKPGFLPSWRANVAYSVLVLSAIIALSAAWRRPALGGGFLFLAGIILLLSAVLQQDAEMPWILPAGVTVMGLLFLADWAYHRANGISS